MQEPKNYKLIKLVFKIYAILGTLLTFIIIVFNTNLWKNSLSLFTLLINFLLSIINLFVQYNYFILDNKNIKWGINLTFSMSIIFFLFLSQAFHSIFEKIFFILIVLSLLWFIQMYNSKEVLNWLNFNNTMRKNYNIQYIILIVITGIISNLLIRYL
jgi:hypothetical protein